MPAQWRIYGVIAKIWSKNGPNGCAKIETAPKEGIGSKIAKAILVMEK